MNAFRDIIGLAAVSTGAILLGSWFLEEVRSARALKKPWYAPYLTPPGVLVVVALALPFLIWLIRG